MTLAMVMNERDRKIFARALPYLDVRSNDEHTAYAYSFARALLGSHPAAREDIVLPAVLLHDVGWKSIPEDKMMRAFGPGAKFPELVRQHEAEGARLARQILTDLGLVDLPLVSIATIIDGHDTRKDALSLEDALVKDADKLWRFTAHGRLKIAEWFNFAPDGALDMLRSYVVPTLLTDAGRRMAEALLAAAEMDLALPQIIAGRA